MKRAQPETLNPHRRNLFQAGALAGASAMALVLAALVAGCDSGHDGDTDSLALRGDPIKPVAGEVSGTAAPQATNAAEAPTPSAGASSQVAESVGSGSDAVAGSGSDYPLVGFSVLAGYPLDLPDEMINTPLDPSKHGPSVDTFVPAKVKALDGKAIAIRGFMLPLKVKEGRVMEMLILKDQSMCCYGTVPKMHEWVSVKMVGDGVKAVMDEPVTLHGKLHVGEMRENGYLVGIYLLEGEKMTVPVEN